MISGGTMFYVYAYCNTKKPISDSDLRFEPFYIGKGCGRRINDHLRDAKSGKTGRRLTYIRKMLQADSLLIVKIQENLEERDAHTLEIELISKFGRKDLKTGCLFNATPGGDGPRHTPETYKAIGDKLRGRTKPLSECAKISASLMGRKRDPADGVKISNTLLGVKHTTKRKQNIVVGMQESIQKQRKKWMIVTPETSYCIVSLDYLKETGIGNLYRSFVSGKPLSKGPLKGWQLFQIKEPLPAVLQHAT